MNETDCSKRIYESIIKKKKKRNTSGSNNQKIRKVASAQPYFGLSPESLFSIGEAAILTSM